MFEERMATEQNGDWLSGSRHSQEAFSQFVITVAKENPFQKKSFISLEKRRISLLVRALYMRMQRRELSIKLGIHLQSYT